MVLVRFRETATRKCLSSCRIGQQQPAAWIYRNTRTPPRHEGRLLEDGVGTKLPERRHGHANSRKRWVTRNSFYDTKNKCGALFVSQFPIFFPPLWPFFKRFEAESRSLLEIDQQPLVRLNGSFRYIVGSKGDWPRLFVSASLAETVLVCWWGTTFALTITIFAKPLWRPPLLSCGWFS